MGSHHQKYIWRALLPALVLVFSGCADSRPPEAKSVLIWAGQTRVTETDFKDAFEIAKIAHFESGLDQPAFVRDIQTSVFNDLLEEAVILEHARDQGISISSGELEAARAEIQKDYPDGALKELLIEQAVPYEAWEKRLKIRLLIQKTLQSRLSSQVDLTPQAVRRFLSERNLFSEDQNDQVSDQAVMEAAKQEILQNRYVKWIKELKNRYEIRINQKLWKKITAMP